MIYFTKPRDNTDELPKAIADAFLEEVDRQSKRQCLLPELSSEFICDCVAMDIFPDGILEYKCLEELDRRLMTASLEEVLSLCEFLGGRVLFTRRYIFSAKYVLYKLLDRADKDEFLKKFRSSGGFESLNIQITPEKFMQFSQEYRKRA